MKKRCLLNTYSTLGQRTGKKNALNLRTPTLFNLKSAKASIDNASFKVSGTQSQSEDVCVVNIDTNPRFNDFGIEMLPEVLRRRLFKEPAPTIDSKISSKCQQDLQIFGLNKNVTKFQDTYDIHLPAKFQNLKEFFESAAESQLSPYFDFIENLAVRNCKLPSLPSEWSREPGWTKYTTDGNVKVPYPSCSSLVFDVEVCIVDGNNLPSLAIAISPDFVYSWVSPGLDESWLFKRSPTTDMLIPLGEEEKVIVGHHVMYDRARVKEEYHETRRKLRFLDTQSLHVCVSGLENSQKGQWLSANQSQTFDKKWMEVGSPNSLAAVHKLYCGSDLDKSARDVFVSGTHLDVQKEFSDLMTYCANDVIATHNVLTQVWPLFKSRFPSKVTLSGMFEMAGCYIPLNENWDKYVRQSDDMFFNKQGEIKQVLKGLADDVLLKYNLDKEKTLKDNWLKQLKWESKNAVGVINKKLSVKARAEEEASVEAERKKVWKLGDVIRVVCEDNVDKPKHYTCAPEWYRQHCPKAATYYDVTFNRGPFDISLSNQISPLLLKISFENYPIYHTHHYGWGYLKTKDAKQGRHDQLLIQNHFPDVDIFDSFGDIENEVLHPGDHAKRMSYLEKQIMFFSKRDEKQCVYVRKDFHKIVINSTHTGNVGNPLGKLFTGAIEKGVIASQGSFQCQQVLKTGTGLTFWRNTRSRILSQFIVKLNDCDVDKTSLGQLSVLLPQAIPAGTLTRRATEPLWLTASNVRKDRVGSEFKGMVSSFPGYCFVGADVDSQELWIASLIGDSTYGSHGATPLGWMSLQGQKSEGTDMHSKTAEQLSQDRPGLVSRDIAKAFNYARIYGAGKGLACSMLKDNSDGLTTEEVSKIIDDMFDRTKGAVVFPLTALGRRFAVTHQLSADAINITEKNLKILCSLTGYPQYQLCNRRKPLYYGGTESAMFNNLEDIARSAEPETPCLKSRITRSLEPGVIKDQQLRSRINWVVQSSAVDFLHLLLVSMKYFMSEYKIPGRFAISIHDEVRFHVPEQFKYHTALALQISNLLTRSLFATQLGINDLPNSVAFFSGIDIDTTLRKNVNDDCITPSNPLGLSISYDVKQGQELDIKELLDKINKLSK